MQLFTQKRGLKALLACCLLFLGAAAPAQRVITGTVTDGGTGEALIGANVVVKEEPSRGTVTDLDGKFRLTLGPSAANLLVSYTGFETVEQAIGPSNDLSITMGESKTLQDVVIIGYGSVKREDATGLVQSVGSEKFNKGAIASPQQLIAGKVAGVVVTTDNGTPGGGAKIRVRGESSLSASNDPLIVVDGVPLDNPGRDGNFIAGSRNALASINPDDIETFTVLKDASAAAIYGNRASAGVILITTKKGALGKKIRVGYTGNLSMGETRGRVDALTATEFRAQIDSLKEKQPLKYANAIKALGDQDTDWQDEIYQKAMGYEHNVNLSGGIGAIPYRVSFGHLNQDGLLRTDNFRRNSAMANISPKFLNNRLQFNLTYRGSRSKNIFADHGAIGNALYIDPTHGPYDPRNRFGGYYYWQNIDTLPNTLAPDNPIALLYQRGDTSTVDQYNLSGSVDYRFKRMPALRWNLSAGRDRAHGSGRVFVPEDAAFAYDKVNGGGVDNRYSATKKNSVLETYLNYKKDFGRHGLELMGGYSWQHFHQQSDFRNSDPDSTAAVTKTGVDKGEYYLVSVFGRMNYSFNDRLLVTGSLRRDGTSRFGPDYRYGLFPAAAVAFKLRDNNSFYFNQLKLRTSWGRTGNQDIGDDIGTYYAYLARYQAGDVSAQYQFGNEYYQTLRPNPYVANIRWEETDSYNVGLDFSIVKNRLGGSIDLYNRDTRDLLNNVPEKALANLSNYVTKNIGDMTSKGIELSLNLTPVSRPNASWDINFNFAANRSEITRLTEFPDSAAVGILVGGVAGGVGSNIQNHQVGYAPYSFFVKKQRYGPNGEFLEGQFEDLNGNGSNDDGDKYRFHHRAPLYTLGLNNTVRLGRWDLNIGTRANLGQYVYFNVRSDMGYLDRLVHSTGFLANVNQSAVDLGAVDQAKLIFSDHFVYDASFFRVDFVSLGYDFTRMVGYGLRLTATVQNPLVVTNYEGLDPEIFSGIDNNIYPRPRTYSLGVKLDL